MLKYLMAIDVLKKKKKKRKEHSSTSSTHYFTLITYTAYVKGSFVKKAC